MQDQDLKDTVLAIAVAARQAATTLAQASNDQKNLALHHIAKNIRRHAALILQANTKDLLAAKQNNLSTALMDRLLLNAERIAAMANGLEAVAELTDPVGKILTKIIRPNGLEIIKKSVPLGVLGVIYESRPNVTADASALAIKSGNAIILRGGSDSFHTSCALMTSITQGLTAAGFPETCVQLIPTVDREAIYALLQLDEYVDVIIPRGGQQLIKHIVQHSRIPLFKHLAGICHTYIHRHADLTTAISIVVNAKMRRTGICGATEVLLIDQSILSTHLVPIVTALIDAGCTVRGDLQAVTADARIQPAFEADFDTEFLDAVIAVKTVPDLVGAVQHIALHGTHHTDAIITTDEQSATTFLEQVDSAIVMHNTSTQFADGGEFGMGAEMGIATGKLHARGPIGVEQLTTFKYQVRGQGQVRP
ncbi:MAG: glutamate-5-semialdehyde dehydrogenase [Gammaproteobacteria bacterium]|nr:glutamate-5-semialdehyde dehydrogenase [Gammaproteobacteria bacterium]